MSLPIRVRLTIWYALLLATIIISLGAFLVLQLRSDLRQATDEEARASLVTIMKAVSGESRESDEAEPADVAEDAEDFLEAAASLPRSSGAQVLDDRGQVLALYGAVAGGGPLVTGRAVTAALAGQSVTQSMALGDEGQHYRVMATEVPPGA